MHGDRWIQDPQRLARLGFGDPDSAPNAAEQHGADTMIAAAHDEVTKFAAAVQAQLATVNSALKARGQPAINW